MFVFPEFEHFAFPDFGNLEIRISGSLDFRRFGSPVFRLSRKPEIRNFRFPEVRKSRILDSGIADFRQRRISVNLNSDIVQPKSYRVSRPLETSTRYIVPYIIPRGCGIRTALLLDSYIIRSYSFMNLKSPPKVWLG